MIEKENHELNKIVKSKDNMLIKITEERDSLLFTMNTDSHTSLRQEQQRVFEQDQQIMSLEEELDNEKEVRENLVAELEELQSSFLRLKDEGMKKGESSEEVNWLRTELDEKKS